MPSHTPRPKVDPDAALESVRAALGDRAADLRVNYDSVDLRCTPENLRDVMETLRDHPDLRCRFFTFLSAIDRSELGEDKGGDTPLELLVHVYSPEHIIHVTVHVPLPLKDATCRTISDIYAGAIWHERECHEMFGIEFEGHPNLVNLYLPEDFEGHPGLRAFKLPSRFVKDWPGAKDPEEAAAGGR